MIEADEDASWTHVAAADGGTKLEEEGEGAGLSIVVAVATVVDLFVTAEIPSRVAAVIDASFRRSDDVKHTSFEAVDLSHDTSESIFIVGVAFFLWLNFQIYE